MKFLRNKKVGFLMGIEKNRLISTVPHQYEQIGKAAIIQERHYTHLKAFDFVKVFLTVDAEGYGKHYVLYGNQQHLPLLSTQRYSKNLNTEAGTSNRHSEPSNNWHMPGTFLYGGQMLLKAICIVCFAPYKN